MVTPSSKSQLLSAATSHDLLGLVADCEELRTHCVLG